MDKPLTSSLARRISLRQLQVFEAIARNENFTRAAEELFLTQPTVSMQLKKLEQFIGAALFEQIGKKVFLTDLGKELYISAREVLETLAHFEMQTSEMLGLKKGHLRLAVVTTAKYYAPYMLGLFCQIYPDIDVSLKVTNRERLLQRLSQNEDDLYIIGRPPKSENHYFIPLIENPLVVIAPRNHPLAKLNRQLSLKEIANENFIIREQGSGTRRAIDNVFKQSDLPIKIKMELGSNEAIKHAVSSGLGISILSRYTLSLEIKEGPVIELDVKGFPISWPWYLGYPTGKRLSPVAKTFLDFVKNNSNNSLAHDSNNTDSPITAASYTA